MSWLIFGFLGYLLFLGASAPRNAVQPAEPSAVPAITQKSYPKLAEITDKEHWKRALNPDYAAKVNCDMPEAAPDTLTMKMTQDELGDGDAAACGETIEVKLTVWNAQGMRAYQGALKLALGAREIASGLDAGLVGIRVGGKRSFTLPPSALKRQKTSTAPNELLKALPVHKAAIVTVTRTK